MQWVNDSTSEGGVKRLAIGVKCSTAEVEVVNRTSLFWRASMELECQKGEQII